MINIDQESDYVPKRPLRWSAIIVVVAIIGSAFATVGLQCGHVREVVEIHSARPARIETIPFEDKTEAERDQLDAVVHFNTYGWVDRKTGTIHVPLEVAIEQYLGGKQ